MNIIKTLGQYIRSKLLGVPFFCHYFITSNCDLHCRQCTVCDDLRRMDIHRHGDMSLEEINILADRLKSIGIYNLLLVGGEPFARKDIEEVVRLLVRKGFSVRIITNGNWNLSSYI